MGDLECGFEEMQGVRLGYLLIQGKQMFALSQVFTELLKNVPRTTVHKRMDHLNVKKHHCDLGELRKLKAINSIAFHAAKCTLISREDVEALYFSCKTERVLKSGHGKSKAASRSAGDGLASAGLLHADAQLWQKKVWLSLHGVQDKARRGRREPRDSKLPHFYHKSHGRGCRPATKPTRRHLKNYEIAKLQGNRVTFSQKHSFFRSAPAAARQSAMAAQSRLSRAAGELHHKRKRRREGGGGRDGPRHPWRSRHRQHVPPVLLVQPRSSVTHRAAFGAFHLSPDYYLHRHHLEPSFPESSDTESSTYSDRAYPDSDFGSGFSTSSSSEEEEEDEDETQSETTEVSTDEEDDESSSHSDSSSVSSRVSLQSIRFRRARVGALGKTLNPITAPLVLQPTFHYNRQQPHVNSPQSHVAAAHKAGRGHEECGFRNSPGSKFLSVIFAEDRRDKAQAGPIPDAVLERVPLEPHASKGLGAPRRTSACPIGEPRGRDKEAKFTGQRLPTPPKKIKTEAEELAVTASPRSESGCKTAGTPPLALHKVKLKAEDCRNEYEYQCQADAVNFKVPPINTKHSANADPPVDVKSDEDTLEAAAACPVGSRGYLSALDRLDEGETRNKKCRASELGGRARLSRAQSRQSRVTRAASSTSSASSHPCQEASAENLPSRRKRSSANSWTCGVKLPFSLMANFPFSPSLAVGSDGDLCPAYSLNSLRGLAPPPPSHPVWSWQPGGHVLPPPLTHRTAK